MLLKKLLSMGLWHNGKPLVRMITSPISAWVRVGHLLQFQLSADVHCGKQQVIIQLVEFLPPT